MKSRIILYADEGNILTDGNIYGTQIYVEDKKSIDDYHEITVEEYDEIMKAQEQENEVI